MSYDFQCDNADCIPCREEEQDLSTAADTSADRFTSFSDYLSSLIPMPKDDNDEEDFCQCEFCVEDSMDGDSGWIPDSDDEDPDYCPCGRTDCDGPQSCSCGAGDACSSCPPQEPGVTFGFQAGPDLSTFGADGVTYYSSNYSSIPSIPNRREQVIDRLFDIATDLDSGNDEILDAAGILSEAGEL
jgi:hypothetical protein